MDSPRPLGLIEYAAQLSTDERFEYILARAKARLMQAWSETEDTHEQQLLWFRQKSIEDIKQEIHIILQEQELEELRTPAESGTP